MSLVSVSIRIFLFAVALTVMVCGSFAQGSTSLVSTNGKTVASRSPSIIPQPQQIIEGKGSFLLDKYTPILISSSQLNDAVAFLRTELLKFQHLPLTLA